MDGGGQARSEDRRRLPRPSGLAYDATPDRFGFPRLRRSRVRQHFGYVTGDLVRATAPSGKWADAWTGHVSVRSRGRHTLTTPAGRFSVSYKNLRIVQRGDEYGYAARREPVGSTSRKTG
ncbi:hypothetical protein AB0H69_42825 [Streptomyces phaeochromogenes]|uniref:hypothetical protein n=1 Tax=Streptomyces phaeochromogenes TaxID=1923 RepID=UPI0033CA83D3